MKHPLLSIILFFICVLNTYSQIQVPELDSMVVKDVLFGYSINDPYRGLEKIGDTRVKEYFWKQDSVTENYLDTLSSVKHFSSLMQKIDYSYFEELYDLKITENGSVFYTKYSSLRGEALFYRKNDHTEEQFLFHPSSFGKKKSINYEITSFQPSWDGTKVLISVEPNYGHTSEVLILDVISGSIEETGISNSRPGEYLGLQWTPDGTAFTYTSLDITDPSDKRVKLNTSLSLYDLKTKSTKIIFGKGTMPETDKRLFPVTQIKSSGDKYIIVYTGGPSYHWDSYYMTFSDLEAGKSNWKPLFKVNDKVLLTKAIQKEDRLYYISETRPNESQLAFVELKKKIPKVELVVNTKNELIKDLLFVGDTLYYHTQKYGVSSNLYSYYKNKSSKVKLPFVASKIEMSKYDESSMWLKTFSPLKPIRNYSVDDNFKFKEEYIYRSGASDELDSLEYELVEVKSHDGEMVPMSIVYKTGMKLNGTNPVLSNSYGAYGTNDDIEFQTHLLSFVSVGGILVFPHIRGGGAKGDSWHKGGQKINKKNGWKDLIACMDYLVDKNYTSHKMITLFAESGGAIPAAMAINERPDIAGSIVLGSGILNPYRRGAIYKSTDYIENGSTKDSLGTLGLLKMDPYLNVKKANYPASLIIHGLKDDRIYMHEPLKYVTRVQELNTGNNPILLDIDKNGTHNDVTDFYGYYARVLGFAMHASGYQPN